MSQNTRAMPLRRAGRSGLYLSALGLGTTSWGDQGDGSSVRVDSKVGHTILDRALEHGITHWDTGSEYGGGDAENIIGEYFASHGADTRNKVILSTKWMGPTGGGRGAVRKAVDGCLRRLQTDYLDIFMLHNPGMDDKGAYLAPIEETWGALDDLVTVGKIHYLGISNAHAINVRDAHEALARAAKDSSRRLALVENCYNVLHRGQVGRGLWTDWVRGSTEAAFLSDLDTLGIGLVPYWAIAQGALSGRYRKNCCPYDEKRSRSPQFAAQYLEGPTFDAIEALAQYAEAKGTTLLHLAIAWLLANKHVASVLVGVIAPEHLDQFVGAAHVEFTKDELAEIDAIAATAEDVDTFCKRYFT